MSFKALDDLPLMLQKREIGQDIRVLIRIEDEVDVLGSNVSCSGFEKHGLVEASPDVFGSVT